VKFGVHGVRGVVAMEMVCGIDAGVTIEVSGLKERGNSGGGIITDG
jgi:hypothetical protein